MKMMKSISKDYIPNISVIFNSFINLQMKDIVVTAVIVPVRHYILVIISVERILIR